MFTLERRKGTSDIIEDIFPQLLQPATSINDTSEACRLSYLDDDDVYFVGAAELWPRFARESSADVSALDGLPPRPLSSLLGRLGDLVPPFPGIVDPADFRTGDEWPYQLDYR